MLRCNHQRVQLISLQQYSSFYIDHEEEHSLNLLVFQNGIVCSHQVNILNLFVKVLVLKQINGTIKKPARGRQCFQQTQANLHILYLAHKAASGT